MRYLFALLLVLTMPFAWADVTLTIVDQDNEPVTDAVIFLPNSMVDTPEKLAIMDQIDESFVPRVLVIQKGQSVTFPNSDDIRHHVYSFSEPKSFELKLYNGNEIPPIEFDKSGIVVLGCNIHDSMIGYILVADNSYAVQADDNGQITLPAKAGDKITLWSERLIEGTNTLKELDITSSSAQTIKLELLPPIEHDHYMDY